VLDVGCGTGTLAVLIKRLYPSVGVTGLDPDPRALSRAGRKASRAGVPVAFDRGFADALPYPDATFDRVFSSMMFHHLEDGAKTKALAEFRRVLLPGGRLEFLDFTEPASRGQGALSRLIHAHHRLKDSSDARILELLTRAGFVTTKHLGDQGLFFGRIAFYQASVGFRD
jgi:ubiquinone/menaquinone biosynthesis C-methylase UbiE